MAKYTTLDQIDLPVIAARYGVEGTRVVALAGGAANSSFRLSSAAGDYVLTILDNHDQRSAQLLAVHTQAIHRLGIPTTDVVPATDGSLVTEMDGRPVILKRWIEGEVKQPLPVSLLPEAGRLLARLHDLPTRSVADLPVGTRRLSGQQLAAIAKFTDTRFAAWLSERLDQVRRVEAERTRPKTVAHGDLFDDNVIVGRRNELFILDWETVSLDDPLLDLGMAAVGLAQEDGVLSTDRLDALLAGYRRIRPLSAEEAVALLVEIEHAALIIAFHRYYRHHVRFPDPAKSTLHMGMIRFVESVRDAAPTTG